MRRVVAERELRSVIATTAIVGIFTTLLAGMTAALLMVVFGSPIARVAKPQHTMQAVRVTAVHLSPFERGMADAVSDLRQGKLKLMTMGLPSQPFAIYRDIMLDEYGVEHVFVAGCMPEEEDVSYAHGYNGVAEMELQRRFGYAFMERINRRAQREYDAMGDDRVLMLW